jgi:hypothetical protein
MVFVKENVMANVTQMFPRAVRCAPDPLGLYFRVGNNDHNMIANLISGGVGNFSGVVVSGRTTKSQTLVREAALSKKLDVILDPQTMQLAMPGAFSDSIGGLPWGCGHVHTINNFDVRKTARDIAEHVATNDYSAVLAPTHYLDDLESPWVQIDSETTNRLRTELDSLGCKQTPIIYAAAVPYAAIKRAGTVAPLIHSLRSTQIDAIWLQTAGFGSDATPTALRRYVSEAAEFHSLQLPVIADKVGGVIGQALIAFGAASGIASGITINEKSDVSGWRKPRAEPSGFGMPTRVYIPGLDMLFKRQEAAALLEPARGRAMLGCTDTDCCPKGIVDTLANPGRHFAIQRIQEMAALSNVPETLRASKFLESFRRKTDLTLKASTQLQASPETMKRLLAQRLRLDALRTAMADMLEVSTPSSFAQPPMTRSAREARFAR